MDKDSVIAIVAIIVLGIPCLIGTFHGIFCRESDGVIPSSNNNDKNDNNVGIAIIAVQTRTINVVG